MHDKFHARQLDISHRVLEWIFTITKCTNINLCPSRLDKKAHSRLLSMIIYTPDSVETLFHDTLPRLLSKLGGRVFIIFTA